nr:MAG TPA: hypothetical protein [Bacteriophage sp.]
MSTAINPLCGISFIPFKTILSIVNLGPLIIFTSSIN